MVVFECRPPTAAEMEPHEDEDVVAAAFDGPRSAAAAGQQLRPGAGGKGRFLLCSFREVYSGIEATPSSLREAYSDAVYFK
jgi:hypothetical protein